MFTVIRNIIALSLVALGLYVNIADIGEVGVIFKVVHIPSIILVVTGIVGVSLMMCEFPDILRFFKMIVSLHKKDLGRTKKSEQESPNLFQTYLERGSKGFNELLESLDLPHVWGLLGVKLAAKIPVQDIKKLLIKHVNNNIDRIEEDISLLRRLSSLAPSIGMFGSILGLVKMLANLQDFESLGPNMSLVLLSTLYGIFVGSMMLLPLIQKVESRRNLLIRNHKNIINWLTGIEENEPSFYMKHKLSDLTKNE